MENNDLVVTSSIEEIEGYAYCDTTAQKCQNDCIFVGGPLISQIN